MNKYENALIEILNGLNSDVYPYYNLYPIEVKECVGYGTRYILNIHTGYDQETEIVISEETYNLLVQLDKDINGKED